MTTFTPLNDKALPQAIKPAKPIHKLRSQLEIDGYGTAAGAEVLGALATIDLKPLLDETQAVRRATEQSGLQRHRFYSTAILYPWNADRLEWMPTATGADGNPASFYHQPAAFNPEEDGDTRYFTPLSENFRSSEILHRLIKVLFASIPRSRLPGVATTPVQVGAHLICMNSHNGQVASVGTPNALHVDGEQFTFIVNILRDNVSGAENVVASRCCAGLHVDDIPADKVLYRTTLTDFLALLGVDDARVAHLVGMLLALLPGSAGCRVALLIDFVQLIQKRTAAAHAPDR